MRKKHMKLKNGEKLRKTIQKSRKKYVIFLSRAFLGVIDLPLGLLSCQPTCQVIASGRYNGMFTG